MATLSPSRGDIFPQNGMILERNGRFEQKIFFKMLKFIILNAFFWFRISGKIFTSVSVPPCPPPPTTESACCIFQCSDISDMVMGKAESRGPCPNITTCQPLTSTHFWYRYITHWKWPPQVTENYINIRNKKFNIHNDILHCTEAQKWFVLKLLVFFLR